MKKLTALLILFLFLILAATWAYAEGIYVSSGSGDSIKILEDSYVESPVNGNVIAVLGNIYVNGKVDGHVIAVFGEVTINSEVSGHVVTVFGKTELKGPAVVMGDVITMGALSKAPEAKVLGQEVRIFGESMNLNVGAIAYLQLAVMLVFTITALIVGLLALLISKSAYNKIAQNIERNLGRKMLLGVLSFLGAGALLLLLLITLIAPVLYIIALLLSTVTAAMFFGRLILKSFSAKNSIYAEFVTGLISITLVKLLIVFLIPQQQILLGFGLVGLFNVFIYSLGLGIHMEQHYSA